MYMQGCRDSLLEFVEIRVTVVGVVGIAVGGLELLGVTAIAVALTVCACQDRIRGKNEELSITKAV